MRVCLLHDIFRAELFGQGGQNHTSAMLEQVLAPVLASLGHQLVRPPAFIMDRPPVLRDFAAAHGLAHDVGSWLRLYAEGEPVEVSQRLVQAVSRMGFLGSSDQDGPATRVCVAGRWVGLSAPYGVAWLQPVQVLTVMPIGGHPKG